MGSLFAYIEKRAFPEIPVGPNKEYLLWTIDSLSIVLPTVFFSFDYVKFKLLKGV